MKQKLNEAVRILGLGILVIFTFLSFADPTFATGNHWDGHKKGSHESGSVTICKMIVNNEGTVATSSFSLPEGSFSITLSSGSYATSSTLIDTFSVNAGDFSPNQKILSETNNAYCITFDELSKNDSYFYSEESVTGSDWISKKYNDQYSNTLDSINDVYNYSGQLWNEDPTDDGERDMNADGHITLSKSRPHRTLIVVNTFEKQVLEEPEESIATVVTTKIVCESKEDLPSWGKGGPDINSNTATDWVAEHNGCELKEGWEFEWAPIGTPNPDNNLPENPFFGAAGGNWTVFGPTNAEGMATTSIDLDLLENYSYVWAREVLKEGFIPFTYGPGNQSNENNESAEIYCNTDVLNYDNYDRVDNLEAGGVYYCVAFNVAETPVENPVCSDSLDNDNDGYIDIEDAACHTDGNANNPESYNPYINNENSKPVVTLIGDNPIVITAGDSFTDPGATADDEEDGDITANIVVGGDSVDSNTAGSYTITYNVQDSEGLDADEVSRTVTVEAAPNPGIIHVCKLIINEEFNVITSSELLPEGSFSMLLSTSTDVNGSPIEAVGWNSSTFAPNRMFTASGNDAECKTITNLPLGSYYYGEENISGTQWATTTKYNDGDSSTVNNILDFFAYDNALFTATTTDDASREINADGNIVLSADRYERTLVVLNQFLNEAVPTQCNDQIDNDGDGKIDINDPACHTDSDLENPDSYDPNIDSENQKPVITLTGESNPTIIVGTSYTEEGATANDEEDGDITANIVVGGDSVDTSTPGTYIVTYNVADSEGLAADEVARTVTVESTGGVGGGETPVVTTSGGGSGGGGGPITTIQISNETIEQTGPGTVTVKWNTNISATRKVLYGTYSVPILLTAPIYGYENDTDVITEPLLTLHSVVITGLTPGETYYFRPWSQGSGHITTGIELTIVPGTSSTPVGVQGCYYLYDFLKIGEDNNPVEVRKLQVFLNEFEDESLEVNGVFNEATFDAVSRFQEKYQNDILTPWGHTASTGYVYILTKKKVNEIYCQSAFPVTTQEQEEIDSFHSFLLSLREAGVITEEETTSGNAPFGDTIPSDVEGGIIDENTVGVKEGESTGNTDNNIAGIGGTVTTKGGVANLLHTGFLSSLAAAAFSLPTNIPDAFICFFTLLLVLIIIYVTSSLVVGAQNTSNLSQLQIRIRKILYFIIGVILAFVGAMYFKIFCIILPLIIVFLILVALLLWYMTRKDESKINTPPEVPMIMPSASIPPKKIETKPETPKIPGQKQ